MVEDYARSEIDNTFATMKNKLYMLRDMSQQNSHQTAANTSLKNTNESEDSKAITNGKTDNITLKTIHIRNSQIEGYMKNQCILCILVSIDRQRLFQFVYDPGIICLSNTPSLHLKWLPKTQNLNYISTEFHKSALCRILLQRNSIRNSQN